jgi:hypothetical protein
MPRELVDFDKFLKTLKSDKKLLAAVKKITPVGPGPIAGDWSCCVTVSNPLRKRIDEISQPVVRTTRPKTAAPKKTKTTKKPKTR